MKRRAGEGNLSLAEKWKLFWQLTNPKKRNDMFNKLKSRKLWATIAGVLITAFGKELGISPDATAWIAGIVASYVLGQGVADHGAAPGSQGG